MVNPLDAIGFAVAALAVAGVYGVARTLNGPPETRPNAQPFRLLWVVVTLACLATIVILFLPWATHAADMGSLGGTTLGVFALLLVGAGFWASVHINQAKR